VNINLFFQDFLKRHLFQNKSLICFYIVNILKIKYNLHIIMDKNSDIKDKVMKSFSKKYYRRGQINFIGTTPKCNDKVNLRDKEYFEKIIGNSIIKSNKRIDGLKLRIKKDIDKNDFSKHYQVNNMFEFNILRKYVNDEFKLKPKYFLAYCNFIGDGSKNLHKNKLKMIIGSEEADYPSDYEQIEFINEKVNVIYAYFFKL